MNLVEAAELVRRHEVSPVELAHDCLYRIEQLNPTLNAFITVMADSALAEAKTAEAEVLGGQWRGPLHGIPIGLKDLIETAGVRTTAASAVLQGYIPEQDAEVVRRLRAAGAVIIGKQNLHEFAYGGSSVISHFGPVHNPRNPAHITGGSSGGSAAAVATGMCFAAIGTDTAGSIREPASFCGVVGLKPSYGLVSTRGIIPLSWSYDHAGPIARTVADAASILQVIAGYDPLDPNSRKFPLCNYTDALTADTRKLRVGIAREYFFDQLDSEVAAAMDNAIVAVSRITASVCDVAVPVNDDRTVHAAEAWTWHESHVAGNRDLYSPETLRRIETGKDISVERYILARRELELLRHTVDQLFESVDVLLTPTVPVPPPRLDELTVDLLSLRKRELVMLRNTRPFNVLGLPAISVPCGRTSDGLPVGLQIAAGPGREDVALAVAHAVEMLFQ